MESLSVSFGRDYNHPLRNKFEFCIFDGETLVERQSGFSSTAQAKRAGLKRADELISVAA